MRAASYPRSRRRRPSRSVSPSLQGTAVMPESLAASPLGLLDARGSLRLVTDLVSEESDALCLALACRPLRDALWARFPSIPRRLQVRRVRNTGRGSLTSGPSRHLQLDTYVGSFRILSSPLVVGGVGWWSRARLEWATEEATRGQTRAGIPHIRPDVLRWLFPLPNDSAACEHIAKTGSLPALQWARDRGCGWDQKTSIAAAAAGHVHVLEWIIDQLLVEGDEAQAAQSSEGQELENDEDAYLARVQHMFPPGLNATEGSPTPGLVCYAAASGGHVPVLEWLANRGCDWHEAMGHEDATVGGVCAHNAAAGGHMAVVQWLYTNESPIDDLFDGCAVLSLGFGPPETVSGAHEEIFSTRVCCTKYPRMITFWRPGPKLRA
jgi:hypothetical protein